jgi:pimeloyl-ACP methyl ester carboxylesterase
MRVVFVHGACVKDGSWWWHRTAELLVERDVASAAPALPSCGETGELVGALGPGLSEDVAAVREVLTASDEPTVVVAHSYGGIVTAEAAAGVDGVRHVLLVSSYLPDVGQSLSSFGGEARPVPRDRSRGRNVHRPPERPGRDVLAGLRSGDPATGPGQDGPSEPEGSRAARAVRRVAARGLDVPRLLRGPGHSRRTATRVRPAGRQRRGDRGRTPPVPVPASRRPRPGAEPVRPGNGVRNASRPR